KVPLPTYPFERQKHWLEATPRVASEGPVRETTSGLREVDHWFYGPVCKQAPPSGVSHGQVGDALWLVFADRYGGGRSVKAYLERVGCDVAFARLWDRYAHSADGAFELNPAGVDDYLKLFETLTADAAPKAINIVHLGSLTRDPPESIDRSPAASQEFGFYSLLHIAQATGELNLSIPLSIGILSNRLHEVTGEERIAPEMATVLGPCGVIPKEFANVKCFNVDLPDERAIDSLPADRIARMIAEFSDPARGQIVAYPGRYRCRGDFERIPLAQAPPAISDVPASRGRLRRNGLYLITGGTGGIGLSISKYLAQMCQPVIVLTRQSAFPEQAAWKELSVTRAAPQRVLRTIDALLEIERCGASVEVQTVDVTDRVRMQAVLRSMQDRHGALNGVIHAAGIVSAELIQSKSRGTAHRVLAPKVYGTMILLELLKDLPLDF